MILDGIPEPTGAVSAVTILPEREAAPKAHAILFSSTVSSDLRP
jgi:hypothetical protein